MRRLDRSRGFTLVEVAVVVVIVGVLAVLGMVGYSKYRATARLSEATNMTASIRAAQEAYKAEKGIYASVSINTKSYYPAAVPGKFATEWGGKCTTCVDQNAWKRLNVLPDGPVMYGYATVGAVGGTPELPDVSTNGAGSASFGQPDAVTATTPHYTTVAKGDTDADGIPSMVVSYSVSNQIFIQQE
jgi:type IV pilus assembly protein PilA